MKRLIILYISFLIIFSALVLYSGEFAISLPEIAGMKLIEPAETYKPDNLFEYINGAAESYLIYEFRELTVQIYENDKEQSVIVEIYRHQNPVQSFGIYSQERPQQSNFLNIGAQAYYEKGMLNFLKGDFYVKIRSYDLNNEDRDVLTRFAKESDKLLTGDAKLPRTISWFPESGKIVNSEKYISRNFLGYPELKNVFTTDYQTSNQKFTAFLLEASNSEESARILDSYLSSDGISYSQDSENSYSIDDPYQGLIGIVRKDKYLIGTVNLESSDLILEFIRIFENQVRHQIQ
jgi:hypothetical protein